MPTIKTSKKTFLSNKLQKKTKSFYHFQLNSYICNLFVIEKKANTEYILMIHNILKTFEIIEIE